MKSSDINTLRDLVDYYLHSPQFLALRGRTQKDYEYALNRVMLTPITTDRALGDTELESLGVADCKIAYQQWVKRGVRMANVMSMVTSLVLSVGEELEIVMRNPMRNVKKMTEGQRKVMWTPDQVKTFLDVAYGEYKWRSIGLIVHMAYAFAQRVGDMRCLKWDNINFDTQRLDLEQSKRRAEVHLPIEDSLFAMLKEQHNDFDFQEFVAPHPYPRSGEYKVYHLNEVSRMVNHVKDRAGLPRNLTAMDMRRTAITEMVEAGVDTTQIMAVSGHSSPGSMRPYIKHTFNSTNNALTRRESYKNA